MGTEYYSFEDFAKKARASLPRFVYDFMEGGSGNERATQENTNAFSEIQLVPRIPDCSNQVSLKTEILGTDYSYPFGISPIGLPGLVHPKAEVIFAKMANKYDVPYVFSSVSNESLDKVTQLSQRAPWFQLYIPKSNSVLSNLLETAENNRCPVLVITVDTLKPGRRIRDLKNGLKLPFRLSFKNILDIASHPTWAARRLLSGPITFPNMKDILQDNPSISFHEMMALQTGGDINWDTIRYIRKYWKNKILLKGVLSATDAVKATEYGIDGIVLSNHGGRQLNYAPAPFSLIDQFRSGGVEKEQLMVDSGIRNGEDIIACLAQGSSFTFLGRLFLFALGANGEQGVDRAFQILTEELNIATALMGVSSTADLQAHHVKK
ncbi:MAG: alpha-hydroxy-acid oxidizing protein [Ketobacter sp.]|nr:MAG: alpha-hydroxy-acid oxidizing protein [Ketobacter sp.]